MLTVPYSDFFAYAQNLASSSKAGALCWASSVATAWAAETHLENQCAIFSETCDCALAGAVN